MIYKLPYLILFLLISLITYSQETYTIGSTEYYTNEFYPKTGFPLVKENKQHKVAFLNSIGLKEIPEGYIIDHFKPLSEGGLDDPSNMQLLSLKQYQNKWPLLKNENNSSKNFLGRTLDSGIKNDSYRNNSKDYSNTLKIQSENQNKSAERKIYTGPRGGKYYINSKGNKTYVQSDNSTKGDNSVKTFTNTTKSSTPASSSRTIYTGPRGGKYYINKNGNKTYIKRN